jgi:hypothetical protein
MFYFLSKTFDLAFSPIFWAIVLIVLGRSKRPRKIR